MDVYQAAISRRSIRRFKDKVVPYDVLEKCVNAARLAPSASNHQLWEFIIIDDEQLMPKVADNTGSWGVQRVPTGNRPKAYIITLINTILKTELKGFSPVVDYDVGIAVENMMLVAQEQGIGTCPVFILKRPELKRLLNIPDNYEIALLLALGYPDESPKVEVATGSIQGWTDDQGTHHVPKRTLEDILHHNKFS